MSNMNTEYSTSDGYKLVKARAECGWTLDLVNAAKVLQDYGWEWLDKFGTTGDCGELPVRLLSIVEDEGVWEYDPSRISIDEIRSVLMARDDADFHRVWQTMKPYSEYDGDWGGEHFMEDYHNLVALYDKLMS